MSASESAIIVEKISKRYRLGQSAEGDKTFAGQLWNMARMPLTNFRRLTQMSKFSDDDQTVFWALRDVSFEVKQGEILGVIGKNGSGKSTLLKILSRITDPTSGTARITGRVASLLEVGTGFHPELTGRENVYMNGTILGMRKKEIDRKFEEIVEFSGISKFIDTPVKFYSSGMKVRLGFAVAAHLDPEILIVDEVLAVGDAEFQSKCLGKMEDVSKRQGRTVLFVSHNMGAVTQLCTKAALLAKGSLQFFGPVDDGVKTYLEVNQAKSIEIDATVRDVNHFDRFDIVNVEGASSRDFRFDENFVLSVGVVLGEWHPNLEISVSVYDNMLRRVFTKNIPLKHYITVDGRIDMTISFPGRFLLPGSYSWIACINHPRVRLYDLHDNVLGFVIHDTGSEFLNRAAGGCVFPPTTEIKIIDYEFKR